jgi:hypothetical protein
MYEEYCKENYDLRRGMNTKIKEKKKDKEREEGTARLRIWENTKETMRKEKNNSRPAQKLYFHQLL